MGALIFICIMTRDRKAGYIHKYSPVHCRPGGLSPWNFPCQGTQFLDILPFLVQRNSHELPDCISRRVSGDGIGPAGSAAGCPHFGEAIYSWAAAIGFSLLALSFGYWLGDRFALREAPHVPVIFSGTALWIALIGVSRGRVPDWLKTMDLRIAVFQRIQEPAETTGPGI